MMNADSRKKATGFLAAAMLTIALAPAQAAIMQSEATASAADSIHVAGMTVTGAPAYAGYAVAIPVSAQPAAKPAKARQIRSKD